jgi:hypothetical protein
MSDLQRAEYERWLLICQALKEAGAVTESDLASPVMSTRTPGERLLADLRHWGNLRARQGLRQGEV